MLAGVEEIGMGNADDNQMVVHYLTLRRAVGILGVLFPLILVIGDLVLGSSAGLQSSISAYHGTVMRGVFVGILFAIGVFLFSYNGYEPSPDKEVYTPSDNAAGNLACVFALAVALFPITSDNGAVRNVHLIAAAALFLTLAYFALYLFTKSGGNPTPDKKARNRVYRICGSVMLACIGLIAIYGWFLEDVGIANIRPVFWLESLALWAFGFSWFVKGEGLRPLNDQADRVKGK